MSIYSLHQSITENIKTRIGEDENLVKYISSQLLLSDNAAYKRIKGITPFTLEEACVLAKHLGISLDALVQMSDDNFSFSFRAVGNNKIDPVSYLKNIAADSLKLDLSTAQIKYASNEFPITQYICFPKLNCIAIIFTRYEENPIIDL